MLYVISIRELNYVSRVRTGPQNFSFDKRCNILVFWYEWKLIERFFGISVIFLSSTCEIVSVVPFFKGDMSLDPIREETVKVLFN